MYNKAIYKTHNGHYGNIMIFCFEQQSFSVEFCRPNWEKVSAKAFVLNSNGTIISINYKRDWYVCLRYLPTKTLVWVSLFPLSAVFCLCFIMFRLLYRYNRWMGFIVLNQFSSTGCSQVLKSQFHDQCGDIMRRWKCNFSPTYMCKKSL